MSIGVRVYRTSDLPVANNTATPIPFDTVRWDDDTFWDEANPTRLTFHTPGTYLVWGSLFFAAHADQHYRTAVIVRNGLPSTDELGEHLNANSYGDSHAATVTSVWRFNPGEYVELYAYQGSGVTLSVLRHTLESPEFAAQLLD